LVKKQLGEISESVDRTFRKVIEPVGGYPFQAGGEDPAQDGVTSGMDNLVLVLTEVLDWVALTGIAIKGWNHEPLGKLVFQYGLGEGRIECINGDDTDLRL